MPVKEAVVAVANDPGIMAHMGELAGVIFAILTPFLGLLAWFAKRTVGRVERDIDKCCDSINNLDDRVSDVEKVVVEIAVLHPMNHPGQEITKL